MSLAFSTSNNIYIRNLAPDITEDVVRNTFKHCDEILSVRFKSYQGSSRKYCIVEFKTSAGITNGSLMNGKLMQGLPLAISVTDPLLHGSDPPGNFTLYSDNRYGLSHNAMAQFQYGAIESSLYNGDLSNKGVSDRTVCVGNIPTDYDNSDICSLFGNVGTIVSCSIDSNTYTPGRFALVEFSRLSEAEEALKLSGITVRNCTLKLVLMDFYISFRIEKPKPLLSDRSSTALPTGSAHYLDSSIIPQTLIEPIRSATINEKLAKVLDMRERLTRKLSQPAQGSNSGKHKSSESCSNNSDQKDGQWWVEISKSKRSRSRNRSRSNSYRHRHKRRDSHSRTHRDHSRTRSSSSSVYTDDSHRKHKSSHHKDYRHRSRRNSSRTYYSRSSSYDKKHRSHRDRRHRRRTSSSSDSSVNSR
ncbi:RNA recognition motif domain containing protein [Theileria equi strain WA]|uniref:RNA recognition motif domain containing protein n=1 Tax=Theileria equi strain WA TaxID=1537102 RepID=L0AVI6_THEEQ|nr:RNA recognition motif domain containing protein [Theileria equi strain WA]AFZ79036.1 RNA recognition motif domain containing protein [Theileria equi strain WA]|eukprot:XP_004828702.1 RNA recognition motif domain containing protein [Theileria equi strain WA]